MVHYVAIGQKNGKHSNHSLDLYNSLEFDLLKPIDRIIINIPPINPLSVNITNPIIDPNTYLNCSIRPRNGQNTGAICVNNKFTLDNDCKV